jgi:hypothetical protein
MRLTKEGVGPQGMGKQDMKPKAWLWAMPLLGTLAAATILTVALPAKTDMPVNVKSAVTAPAKPDNVAKHKNPLEDIVYIGGGILLAGFIYVAGMSFVKDTTLLKALTDIPNDLRCYRQMLRRSDR